MVSSILWSLSSPYAVFDSLLHRGQAWPTSVLWACRLKDQHTFSTSCFSCLSHLCFTCWVSRLSTPGVCALRAVLDAPAPLFDTICCLGKAFILGRFEDACRPFAPAESFLESFLGYSRLNCLYLTGRSIAGLGNSKKISFWMQVSVSFSMSLFAPSLPFWSSSQRSWASTGKESGITSERCTSIRCRAECNLFYCSMCLRRMRYSTHRKLGLSAGVYYSPAMQQLLVLDTSNSTHVRRWSLWIHRSLGLSTACCSSTTNFHRC